MTALLPSRRTRRASRSSASSSDGKTALFVVGADGTGLRQLTAWEDEPADGVEWSAGRPHLRR